MMRPPSSIAGIPVTANRLVIASHLTRNAAWYTEIITPPEGCYQAIIAVRLDEVPVTGNELRVAAIGQIEAFGGAAWSTPSLGAFSLHEHVTLLQFENSILISPNVTDGGPGGTRLWFRRGSIDRRLRVWFYYAGAGGVDYTYSADIHFLY